MQCMGGSSATLACFQILHRVGVYTDVVLMSLDEREDICAG